MNNNVIHETGTYKVVVGPSETVEPVRSCYKIVNVRTGVTEAETSIMVSAIAYADQFQEQYDEFMSKDESPSPAIVGSDKLQ